MFKVPDWGTDIPKTNVNFTKKANNIKLKNDFTVSKPTWSPVQTPKNKAKSDLWNTVTHKITNGNKSHTKNKPKKRKQNSSNAANVIKNEEIFTEESEGFEMDEILVNAKKKKLNEIYKKEDCEELLFGEETKEIESSFKIPRGNKKLKSKLTNGNDSNQTEIAPTKRKHNEIRNKDINGLIISAKKIKLNETVGTESKLSQSRKNENKISLEENNSKKFKVNEKVNTLNNVPNFSTTTEEQEVKVVKQKTGFKKEKFKQVLELNHRRSINVTGNKLRERMLEKLKAAQFRFLNEKLYTSSGNEAHQIFQSDPSAFSTYHQGYQQQVKKWPVNPLDVIVKKIQKMPKNFVIADMGCGEAALSKRVSQKVHSFDLVTSAPGVVACDMARTPLLKQSTDVVVYCLALMGTELTQYLVEANRVLKTGGQLLIAEVESRFEDVTSFSKLVERLGFKLKTLDKQHSVFFFLHFVKVCEAPVKKAKLPVLTLKPCLYKRR